MNTTRIRRIEDLTDEQTARLLDATGAVLPARMLATYAGIDRDAFADWMSLAADQPESVYAQLYRRILAARVTIQRKLLTAIIDSARRDDDEGVECRAWLEENRPFIETTGLGDLLDTLDN